VQTLHPLANRARERNIKLAVEGNAIEPGGANSMNREAIVDAIRNGQTLPDKNLAGIDLSNLDLSGANLAGCDLSGANLRNANLHRADLSDCRLCKADLRGADLSRANLSGADLIGARLRRANLTSSIRIRTKVRKWAMKGAYIAGPTAYTD
jgi:uncharacterized protein YjbI with pentapeptide repeats